MGMAQRCLIHGEGVNYMSLVPICKASRYTHRQCVFSLSVSSPARLTLGKAVYQHTGPDPSSPIPIQMLESDVPSQPQHNLLSLQPHCNVTASYRMRPARAAHHS